MELQRREGCLYCGRNVREAWLSHRRYLAGYRSHWRHEILHGEWVGGFNCALKLLTFYIPSLPIHFSPLYYPSLSFFSSFYLLFTLPYNSHCIYTTSLCFYLINQNLLFTSLYYTFLSNRLSLWLALTVLSWLIDLTMFYWEATCTTPQN